MRAIIGEFLYDTEKAKKLCSWEDDFDLYKTDKGNYFYYKPSIIKPICDSLVKEKLGLINVSLYIQEFGKPKEA